MQTLERKQLHIRVQIFECLYAYTEPPFFKSELLFSFVCRAFAAPHNVAIDHGAASVAGVMFSGASTERCCVSVDRNPVRRVIAVERAERPGELCEAPGGSWAAGHSR